MYHLLRIVITKCNSITHNFWITLLHRPASAISQAFLNALIWSTLSVSITLMLSALPLSLTTRSVQFGLVKSSPCTNTDTHKPHTHIHTHTHTHTHTHRHKGNAHGHAQNISRRSPQHNTHYRECLFQQAPQTVWYTVWVFMSCSALLASLEVTDHFEFINVLNENSIKLEMY